MDQLRLAALCLGLSTAATVDAQSLRRLATFADCCAADAVLVRIADVDGDGRDDVAVGEQAADRVRLFSSRTGAAMWSVAVPGSGLGSTVAAAGDVDGDAVEDVIVGVSTLPARCEFGRCRAARVLSGRDGRVLRETPTDVLQIVRLGDVDGDGTVDHLVHDGRFAQRLTAAGLRGIEQLSVGVEGFLGPMGALDDIDGDGIRDFALVRNFDGPGGSFGGFAPTVARLSLHSGASGALLRPIDIEFVQPAGAGAVTGIGDVDGDGMSDLVFTNSIAAAPSRPAELAERDDDGTATVISARTGALLWEIAGDDGEQFGASAFTGDFDADGVQDLLVGAPGFGTAGAPQRGRVQVVSGRTRRALAAYAGPDDGAAFRFGSAVLDVGDQDGDGIADVAIASDAGGVSVYAGVRLDVAIDERVDGAWLDPAHPAQGLVIDAAADRTLTVGWFTHAEPAGAGGGLRWLSGAGVHDGRRVRVALHAVDGGQFLDDGGAARAVGEIELDFTDCATAVARYRLDANALTNDPARRHPALTGELRLQRAASASNCGGVEPSQSIAAARKSGASLGRTSAVGDLDGDGVRDIVADGLEGALAGISSRTLQPLWTVPGNDYDYDAYSAVDVGDVDSDGRPDFAIRTAAGMYVLSGRQGQALYGMVPADPAAALIAHAAAVPDLDGDGAGDIVVGVHDRIDAYSGRDGTPLAAASAALTALHVPAPASAQDYTPWYRGATNHAVRHGDGLAIASLSRGGTRVAALDAALRVRWQVELPPTQESVTGAGGIANAGDVDRDGEDDLLVLARIAAGPSVRLLSGADGRVLLERIGTDRMGYSVAQAAGDVDADGVPDLLIGIDGSLRVWSGRDGRTLALYPTFPARGSALLGDADGDGIADFHMTGGILYGAPPLPAIVERCANGPWHDPATPGQGIAIEVMPERGSIAVGWFTHARSGDPRAAHRWFSGQGTLDGRHAELVLYASDGGRFAAPNSARAEPVGTLQLDFADGTQARARYRLEPAAFGAAAGSAPLTGEFDIEAFAPSPDCVAGTL